MMHITEKFFDKSPLVSNVRRYVALAQSRGARVFALVVRYRVCSYYFILALAKTITPGGESRREPGQAAPPTTSRSSLARKSRGAERHAQPTCSSCHFIFPSSNYSKEAGNKLNQYYKG